MQIAENPHKKPWKNQCSVNLFNGSRRSVRFFGYPCSPSETARKLLRVYSQSLAAFSLTARA